MKSGSRSELSSTIGAAMTVHECQSHAYSKTIEDCGIVIFPHVMRSQLHHLLYHVVGSCCVVLGVVFFPSSDSRSSYLTDLLSLRLVGVVGLELRIS